MPKTGLDGIAKIVDIDKTAQKLVQNFISEIWGRRETKPSDFSSLCFPSVLFQIREILKSFKCIVSFTYLIHLCKDQGKNN
jgi:hypothetical protein